jgi:hypothetical protein
MKQISFASFESYFRPIFNFLERSVIIDDAVRTIFGDISSSYSEESNMLCDAYISLISDFLDLKDEEIIPWFVHDNDMGKKGLSKNEEKINSLAEFYNFLQKSY